jgi:DNA polymerase-3 subunit gamma/tau
MAYKALYRLYRPQSFDEVVGQKYILQTLKNAIKENKITHAYLFSGPRGTGKTSMAKLLAKALNCTSDEEKPCGKCENCLAIANGSHPDVIEIDAASNNGVNEVRELIDKVKYAPISGKYKVYIIDEVHMMSAAAFNALLKTLEEPPAHVIFILATTEPQKVLPTVLSRCQRFDFGRLSSSDLKKRIETVLNSEKIDFEEGVVDLIATLAEGGMRDALGILDQAIAYAGNHLTQQHVRDIYGVVSSEELIKFLLLLSDNDVKAVLEMIENFDLRGVDIVRITNSLINILKDVIVFKSTNDESLLQFVNEKQAKSLIKVFNIETCFTYIDVLTEALVNYKRVNALRGFFELAALKLCHVGSEKVETIMVEKPIPQTQNPIKEEVKPVKSSKKEEKVKDSLDTKVNNEYKEVKEEKVIQEVIPQEVIENKDVMISSDEIVLTDDELLNILMQNSKDEKAYADDKWQLIDQYIVYPNFANASNMLKNTKPVAYSQDAMIIEFSNEAMANRVNDRFVFEQIKEFLKELLGKDVVYYGLSKNKVIELRNEYINRKANNTLKNPYPIKQIKSLYFDYNKKEVNEQKAKEEVVESNATILAKKIFGDLVKED